MTGRTHAALALTGIALGAPAAFVWATLRPPPSVLWLRSSTPVRVIERTFDPPSGVEPPLFGRHRAAGFTRDGPVRIAPDGTASTWGRFQAVTRHLEMMGGVWSMRPARITRTLCNAGLPLPRERYLFSARASPVTGGTAWEFVLYRPE